MYRWLCLVALAGLLGACAETYDDNRLNFGISADRPETAASDPQSDQKITAYLDSRLNQICTAGYDILRKDIVPAENKQQLVDWEVRCRPYQLSLF